MTIRSILCHFLFSLFIVPFVAKADDQCETLSSALKAAETLRELKRERKLQCKSLGKSEFFDKSNDYLFELVRREDLEHIEKLYKLIGLVASNFDYVECYLKQSNEYAQAFYHIFEDAVYLPAWKTVPFDILVHEAVHAIQNEHYPLKEHAKRDALNTDQALGYVAMIEGDARAVQARYLLERPEQDSGESKLEKQPDPSPDECAFSKELESVSYFPYEYGERFVSKLDEKQIHHLLKFPPSSSAAIIHPNLYSQEPNSPIPLDKKAVKAMWSEMPDKYDVLFVDQIGQFVIRMIFEQYMGKKQAVLGTIGWRADTAYLIEAGADVALFWVSSWASEKDAIEFEEAVSKVFSEGSPRFSSKRNKSEVVAFRKLS